MLRKEHLLNGACQGTGSTDLLIKTTAEYPEMAVRKGEKSVPKNDDVLSNKSEQQYLSTGSPIWLHCTRCQRDDLKNSILPRLGIQQVS